MIKTINRLSALMKTINRLRRLRLHRAKRFIVFTERNDLSLAGFTMVEVVILMAMLILIMGIVLVNFPAFSQRLNLKHSSQRLALSMRRAQNMAFAVRQVNTANCGPIVPAYYGIYLNTAVNSDSYAVFADLPFDPATCRRVQADGLYGRGDNDFIVETVKLDPGVSLERIGSQSQGGEGVLNITFSVPEARMKISNERSSVGEYAEIFLAGTDPNFRRSIFIRTSGQIYTR